ncbi:MAG: hypothetical protein RLZZ493_1859 [Bacteroidota bacterium]|jgi:uncharacterized protein YkwD
MKKLVKIGIIISSALLLSFELLPETNEIAFHINPSGKEEITPQFAEQETKFISYLNTQRVKRKLKPLRINSQLMKAARYHAADMATEGYFNHDTHNIIKGKTVKTMNTFDRVAKFYPGFTNCENIAAGSTDYIGVYNQWFNSPGHKENMFNATSDIIGVGCYYDEKSPFGYYWVMNGGVSQ